MTHHVARNPGKRGILRRLRVLTRYKMAQEDGATAIEIAFILPFLALLLFGAVEMFLMSMASRKMTRVTNTVGDLITQAKGTLHRSDIQGYYMAARHIMGKFPSNQLALSVFTYTWDSRRKKPRLSWRHNLGKYVCRSKPPTLTAQQRASMRDGNDLVITYGCYRYQVQIGRIALGSRLIRMTDDVTLRPRRNLRVICTDCSS